jgi:very-short-patch-repair endonuclease
MAQIRRSVGHHTTRARKLRERQTKAESLLWDILRANQLCGLKFRRQHPIAPFVADFACAQLRWIVEIDGGYHDYQYEDDQSRQRYLEERGWSVMRFSNEEVLENVDGVSVAIAKRLGLPFEFKRRNRNQSGMMSPNAPNNQSIRRSK